MNTELSLNRITPEERRKRRSSAPRAWWIPTDKSATWVQAIEELGLVQADPALFPIARKNRKDGAILISATPSGRASHCAIPLFEFLPSLWIPYDARPAVSIDKADADLWLITDHAVFFPDGTLLHLDQAKALHLIDLLAPPIPGTRNWISSSAAETFTPRIRSISTFHAPTYENLVEGAKDDIGSKSPKDIKSNSPLGKFGDKLAKFGLIGLAGPPALLLGAFLAIYKMLPGGASSPTALDRFANWASVKIDDLTRKQNTEIERLKNLFEDDPDKALQHALTLGGEASRGIGAPSTTLSWNKVDFNLSKIGGSSPASPWQMDPQTWSDLTNLYRKAANREIELNRHRRAAYIYAHLLQDLPAAANALKAGGFFTDAAAVYKKLGRSKDEADCHVLAGDIERAAALYRKISDLAQLARLYEQLGREDDARAVWREEIDRLLGDRNVTAAARIMQENLSLATEAIELLANEWPQRANLSSYLGYELELRRAHQQPDTYRNRLDFLLSTLPLEAAPEFVDILMKEFRRDQGDPRSPWIADTIRLTTSRTLLSDSSRPKIALLDSLATLDPADPIHSADARRFRQLSLPTSRKIIRIPPKIERDIPFTKATVERRFIFPFKVSQIMDIAYCRDGFVGLVRSEGKLRSFRFHSDGSFKVIEWSEPPALRSPLQISIHEQSHNIVTMASSSIETKSTANRAVDSSANNERFIVMGPRYPDVIGACSGASGAWHCRLLDGNALVLEQTSVDGKTRSYHLADIPPHFDLNFVENENISLRMAAFGKVVYMAFGSMVARFSNEKFTWTEFPAPILQLRKSPEHTKERLLLITASNFFVSPVDVPIEEPSAGSLTLSSDSTFLHNGLLASIIHPGSIALQDPADTSVADGKNLLPLALKIPPSTRIVRRPNRNGFSLITPTEIIEYNLS